VLLCVCVGGCVLSKGGYCAGFFSFSSSFFARGKILLCKFESRFWFGLVCLLACRGKTSQRFS
jgi:hypothetical protein